MTHHTVRLPHRTRRCSPAPRHARASSRTLAALDLYPHPFLARCGDAWFAGADRIAAEPEAAVRLAEAGVHHPLPLVLAAAQLASRFPARPLGGRRCPPPPHH